MKPEGIPKGYRLRAETHMLVERVQKKIQGTKDEVISRACKMFYESIANSSRNAKYKKNNK